MSANSAPFRRLILRGVAMSALIPAAAHADDQPPADIVVTAHKLDEARAAIQPALGATSYGVDQKTIQALPGGDNQSLSDLILQVPGVAQDGFGQIHVRDDHANLQYRINGTILPEGLAVFGQALSPRLIDHFDLLTGALPAQYGLRTAGIMDITTKTGFANGGSLSLYGGSHGTIEPSGEYGGSTGNTNYFVSADYKRDNLGVDSVDGSSNPLHDHTDQFTGFAYVDRILDADNRISFLGGYSNQWFQIPNPRGLSPTNGYTVGAQTDYLSNNLNETQLERTGFGQLALLHSAGPLTLQTSLSARYSELRYRPDVTGELLFNGEAQAAFKNDLALGLKADGSYKASTHHTIRFGLYLQHDHSASNTDTFAYPLDAAGDYVAGTQPVSIPETQGSNAFTASIYAQDEWKLSNAVILNYGLRFDHYGAYRSENQLSPRINMVWRPTARTTAHIGYARYFSPPPFELVGAQSLTPYAGTTAGAPAGALDTTPFSERQHYFDVGVQQKVGPHLTLGIDGYYRISTNLIDEGQFGAPIILTPFNYSKGRIRGIEFNASYEHGPWLTYANFAMAKAQGTNIDSSQFNFNGGDLAYIAGHYVFLDHDQTYTGSGGITYAFRDGALKGLKLASDVIIGSGLRADEVLADGSSVPNGAHLPAYAQVNLSASYRLARQGVTLRVDVINVGDHAYEIRDGTGIGVGAPEWGPRRGFFFGLTKDI